MKDKIIKFTNKQLPNFSFFAVLLAAGAIISSFRLLWLGEKFESLLINIAWINFFSTICLRACSGFFAFEKSSLNKAFSDFPVISINKFLFTFSLYAGNLVLCVSILGLIISFNVFQTPIFGLLIMTSLSLLDFGRIGINEIIKRDNSKQPKSSNE